MRAALSKFQLTRLNLLINPSKSLARHERRNEYVTYETFLGLPGIPVRVAAFAACAGTVVLLLVVCAVATVQNARINRKKHRICS